MNSNSIISFADLTQNVLANVTTFNVSGLDPNSIPYIDSGNNLADYVLTNGQVLIGSTNNPPVPNTITGTVNQIAVTNSAGSIVLSGPQDVAPGSSVTFASITDTELSSSLVSASSGGLLQDTTITNTNANGSNNTLSFAGSTVTMASTMTQDLSSSGDPTFAGITLSGPLESSFYCSGDTPSQFVCVDSNSYLHAITGAATDGTLLIGNSFAKIGTPGTLTGSADIIITNGPGSISIDTVQPIQTTSSPTFANITDTGIAANSLIYNNPSQELATLALAVGESNGISLSLLSGVLTASATQNLASDGSPTFTDITISGLTASELVATNASKELESVAITNANGTNVSFSGATLACTMTQNLTTSGSPTFANITDSGLTASELVATNASKELESVAITNANGTNVSFSGATLACTMTQNLTTSGSPSFTNVSLTGLAAGLVGLTSAGVAVGDAVSTATGMEFTTNVSTGITRIDTPQSVQTSATPLFTGLYLGVAANSLLCTSAGSLVTPATLATTTGMTLNVSAGTMTLNTPQNLQTTASPTFNALTTSIITSQAMQLYAPLLQGTGLFGLAASPSTLTAANLVTTAFNNTTGAYALTFPTSASIVAYFLTQSITLGANWSFEFALVNCSASNITVTAGTGQQFIMNTGTFTGTSYTHPANTRIVYRFLYTGSDGFYIVGG